MDTFRTIEISEPAITTEHLRFITVKSPALKRRADISLFLPPDQDASPRMPLVILLHGVYGSHWAWPFLGHAHVTAWDMIQKGGMGPMAIAMPSDGLWGDGSGYLSHVESNYEAWIVDDVPALVRSLPENAIAPTRLYIAGLSMGGYGALRLGAKYPTRFSGISGHSSITQFCELAEFVVEPLEAYPLQNQDDADVFYWMKKNQEALPPIRFDCGIEDTLIEGNRKLHARLKGAGVTHTYQEFPGAHSWDYWTEHLQETLTFFDRIEKSYARK